MVKRFLDQVTKDREVKANVIDQVLPHRDLGHQAKTVKMEKVQQKEKSRKVPVRLENQLCFRVSAI